MLNPEFAKAGARAMKILLLLPVATVLAVGCGGQDSSTPKAAASGTARPEKTPPDQKGLDGTWKVVSIGGDGKTMLAERIGDMKVTISGPQYTTTKGGKVIERATMTADASKQTKTIDLAVTEGEAKGQSSLGIYELAGDTLRIALAEPGKPRATEIVNRAGLRQDLWELRRE